MISLNLLLMVYIGTVCVITVFDLVIAKLNTDHMKKHGTQIPSIIKGIIDEKELKKIHHYTVDNERFAMLRTGFSKIIFFVHHPLRHPALVGPFPRKSERCARRADFFWCSGSFNCHHRFAI